MSTICLVTTREPDLAELAFCEDPDCECYISLEAVPAHQAEDHVITFLLQEIA